MIKVNNLHKHFGKLEVLNGIDEHIKPGEKVVVIGPSGSGKSTFLRCLNLLETPTGKDILINGIRYSHTDTRRGSFLIRRISNTGIPQIVAAILILNIQ